MFLKNITINSYKSIQKATVSFEDGLNIIIGKNGSGKSNLLEFINLNVSYFSILGKSKYTKNYNFEFGFTVFYNDENSNYEFIVFKKDKSSLNERVEHYKEIKFSK